MSHLGSKIRELRLSLNESQEEFSKRLACSATWVGVTERGLRQTSITSAMTIADRLGIGAQELIQAAMQDKVDALGLAFIVRLEPGTVEPAPEVRDPLDVALDALHDATGPA